jgi:hypothetical protein
MILPEAGTWKNGNGGKNFDPYTLGPANFYFTVEDMTVNTVLSSSNITGLNVGFGTTPDTTLGGTVTVVPLPAAAWLGMGLLASLGALGAVRKLAARAECTGISW